MRKLDDSRVNQNGEIFIRGQPDSILSQLEIKELMNLIKTNSKYKEHQD
jgi:hypothetical protein